MINHIWQSTVVVGVAWLLTLMLRKYNARTRYWVWMGASMKFLLPFSLLMEGGEFLRSLVPTPATPVAMVAATVMEQIAEPFPRTEFSNPAQMSSPTHHASLQPLLIFSIWAFGALVVAARFGYAWGKIHGAKRSATRLELVADLPVFSSSVSIEPGIFGIFRPVLLLPEGIQQQLTFEQMRTIVAHEVCHLRRRDNLTYAIHMVVETLFWFHPAVWWIGMKLIDERERACDEEVVQDRGAAQAYAEGILKVCEFYLESPLGSISGVSGGNLKRRILHIMSAQRTIGLTWRTKSLLVVSVLIILALPLALGLAQPAMQNAASSMQRGTLALGGAVPEISLYGPVTANLKAGDIAPGIIFTKILNTPSSAEWKQSNLRGQLTILVFSLRTSKNPQIVTLWNQLVDEFAGKPVQFLMVSGEPESTLLPWLRENPIKGWVFGDADGKTGNAYGLQEPGTVFIGTDGKIIGFGFGGFPPRDAQVNAALEGRITTTPQTPATMKAFLESHQVILNAEPFKFPRADAYKPPFPPSYAIHVTPSQRSQAEGKGNFGGPDYRVLRNYTLKDAIGDAYGVNPIRISLPASLEDNRRYDFSILLPQPEGEEKIKTHMQQGIQDYFHLVGKREERMTDVYVVTAAPDHAPTLVKHQGEGEFGAGGGFSGGGIEFTSGPSDVLGGSKSLSLKAVSGVSFTGTAGGFCQMMESELDRPVVDETHWEGDIDINVKGEYGPLAIFTNPFLERLRDQAGVVIAPAQRKIDVLVFSPR